MENRSAKAADASTAAAARSPGDGEAYVVGGDSPRLRFVRHVLSRHSQARDAFVGGSGLQMAPPPPTSGARPECSIRVLIVPFSVPLYLCHPLFIPTCTRYLFFFALLLFFPNDVGLSLLFCVPLHPFDKNQMKV